MLGVDGRTMIHGQVCLQLSHVIWLMVMYCISRSCTTALLLLLTLLNSSDGVFLVLKGGV